MSGSARRLSLPTGDGTWPRQAVVVVPAWRVRDFHEDDLDQAIQVWDQSRLVDEPLPVFPVSEVMAAARAGHSAVAERYGVAPPKAVILFGPPGTGKTSFAKAVASRLGWPFVELFPSRLAVTSDEGLAASLRHAFADLAELESVLLFIDEVEEIAGARSGRAIDPGHGVTNELLKLIPGFREFNDRLLICATNSVRSLDSAFLRPGRFDYIIPIGPPDPAARAAIWSRYLGPTASAVDQAELVAASEMFTPADIEFAAHKGAHAAFEREVLSQQGEPASTDDYLTAIADTRPTLTGDAITAFNEDIEQYTRL